MRFAMRYRMFKLKKNGCFYFSKEISIMPIMLKRGRVISSLCRAYWGLIEKSNEGLPNEI